MQIIVKTNQAAEFFKVNKRTLQRWRDIGCPGVMHGKVDIHAVFGWWQENIMSSKVEVEDKDLGKIKMDYWSAKAESEQVKVEILKEKYIAKADISKQWAYRAGVYKSHLLAFASRLPPLLEGKNQLEMREIMTVEAINTLTDLTKNEKYCPKEALPKDYSCVQPEKKKKLGRPRKKPLTSGRKK